MAASSDPAGSAPQSKRPARGGGSGGAGGGPLAKENRRLVVGLVVGALAAAFAVVNLDRVQVDWIVSTTSTPLIVVIAIAFVLGAVMGWVGSAVGRRRRGS